MPIGGYDGSLQIGELSAGYSSGKLRPAAVITAVYQRIAASGDDHVWIDLLPIGEVLAAAAGLEEEWDADDVRPALYGIPFAVKDNIDVAGRSTTAACPQYAYVADADATLVDKLLQAGALLIGKTNLDQFATGLSGVRSPYGICTSPFDETMISGGSSSGSAVAVARGLVSFAIGTDTAGSGRVPAAFTNTVGIKPSRGLVSTAGIVPACRSLDCPSVFALSVPDARAVLSVIAGHDAADPFSRQLPVPSPVARPVHPGQFRVGIPTPETGQFFGDRTSQDGFDSAINVFREAGVGLVPVDLEPFTAVARMLYDGPWIAERFADLGEFVTAHPEAVHPVTLAVLSAGSGRSAADAFRGFHKLAAAKAQLASVWDDIDVLMVPTVPRPYSIAQMLDDPITLNANLGTYTNFVNLLNLAAIAVPAGFTDNGLPHGITLIGTSATDARLADIGDFFHRKIAETVGATPFPLWSRPSARRGLFQPAPGHASLAVAGAHLRGMPLHSELITRNARLLGRAMTSDRYRLFALKDSGPPRPGLVRTPSSAQGGGIEVEVYELRTEQLGDFLTTVQEPLAIGTIELRNGERVLGFVCEAYATDEAIDITSHGGWRAYRQTAHLT